MFHRRHKLCTRIAWLRHVVRLFCPRIAWGRHYLIYGAPESLVFVIMYLFLSRISWFLPPSKFLCSRFAQRRHKILLCSADQIGIAIRYVPRNRTDSIPNAFCTCEFKAEIHIPVTKAIPRKKWKITRC